MQHSITSKIQNMRSLLNPFLFFGFFIFFINQNVSAQEVTLVKDIFPGMNGGWTNDAFIAFPEFVPVGDYLLFKAYNEELDMELWRTDGSEAGTSLLKDFNMNGFSNIILKGAHLNGYFYFSADDGINGNQIWVTDGTPQGTQILKDFLGSNSNMFGSGFTLFNGEIYFNRYQEDTGGELWKTDGTLNGTQLVADIYPGVESSEPSNFTLFNGELFFSASHPDFGRELWKYNPDSDVAELVIDLVAGPDWSSPATLSVANDKLYFKARLVAGEGREPYVSDGTTAGTLSLGDFTPGDGQTLIHRAFGFGDYVYIVDITNDKTWRTDGTPDGTEVYFEYEIFSKIMFQGDLYFNANLGDGLGAELYKMEAGSTTPELVADIITGNGSSSPSWIVEFNDNLIFSAKKGGAGRELWKSNGSQNGTNLVIQLDEIFGIGGDPQGLFVWNDAVYFSGWSIDTGRELWRYGFELPFNAQITEISSLACNGDMDAALQVNITSGTAPYTYAWNVADIEGAEVSDLAAGVYEVTVTDANGQIVVATYEIEEPPALDANTSSTNATGSEANGSATVMVNGGTPPYSYEWNTDTVQTSETAIDLVASDYVVTVIDANGCIVMESVLVEMTTGLAIANNNEISVQISPNPSDGLFNIELQNLSAENLIINIFSVEGQALLEQSIDINTDQMLKVNLEAFPAGAYFFNLRNAKGQVLARQKLIKH